MCAKEDMTERPVHLNVFTISQLQLVMVIDIPDQQDRVHLVRRISWRVTPWI